MPARPYPVSGMCGFVAVRYRCLPVGVGQPDQESVRDDGKRVAWRISSGGIVCSTRTRAFRPDGSRTDRQNWRAAEPFQFQTQPDLSPDHREPRTAGQRRQIWSLPDQGVQRRLVPEPRRSPRLPPVLDVSPYKRSRLHLCHFCLLAQPNPRRVGAPQVHPSRR